MTNIIPFSPARPPAAGNRRHLVDALPVSGVTAIPAALPQGELTPSERTHAAHKAYCTARHDLGIEVEIAISTCGYDKTISIIEALASEVRQRRDQDLLRASSPGTRRTTSGADLSAGARPDGLSAPEGTDA